MNSKIITVLFAIIVISAANGFINSKLRVLEPIFKCYEGIGPEFTGAKKMAARLKIESETDDLKLSCLVIGDYVKCLADVLEETPSPVPKVFLFYGAEAYQTSYLLKKANLCPGIKYDNLKRIVLNSDIMNKEGLSNIENDHYEQCAGDAMKKCLIESMQVSEIEQGDPDAGDDADDAYIFCIEEQTTTCNAPIMYHFFEDIKAYKKHVKELEMLESEEQHEYKTQALKLPPS